MEILTGQQMRSVDRRAIDRLGIPGIELMENAGRGLALAFLEDHRDAAARGVVIVCGKGNNGGDGLVAARHLLRHEIRPQVILLADPNELKGDAAESFAAARRDGVEVVVVTDEAGWRAASERLPASAYFIDGILGTGVRGGARGLAATVIHDLNARGVRAVAIDMPSGMDADSSTVEGEVLRAQRTYTLCRPKFSLVLSAAQRWTGSLRVVPIGIPDAAVAEEQTVLEWLDAPAAAALLPVRPPDAHKGMMGHLLALAGSPGKSGAAILLARGALRAGVGLLTVAARESCRSEIAAGQAEMMTAPLRETGGGGLGSEAAAYLTQLLVGRDALAVGPGLGSDDSTRAVVAGLLAESNVPAVVDADGLAAVGMSGPRAPRRPALVLTPHPGEAGRMLGLSAGEVQADRVNAVRALVQRTGATVVLKGHRSLIAAPDGRLSVNASGNPGMATPGCGDVLTGIVGALLARGLPPFEAARLAVFLHGDAGDRAANAHGEEGLIASDLVDCLPLAFQGLARERPR